MFGVKSVKIADPDNPQKKIEDYWKPSQVCVQLSHRPPLVSALASAVTG